MITRTFLADRLSGLTLHFRSTTSARRRRANRRLQVADEVLRLEERCMLSTSTVHLNLAHHVALKAQTPHAWVRRDHAQRVKSDAPTPPAWTMMPTPNSQDNQNAVMYQTPQIKKVTITNNYTNHMIYPVLAAPNDPSSDNGNKPYDPYDLPAQQYRIYVGYTQDGQNYVGLKPGASITFDIPYALWDGGRIYFVTDTPTTESSFFSNGNPYNFDSNSATAKTYTQSAELKEQGTKTSDGMLLFYHGYDQQLNTAPPGIDTISSAAQVAEFTIRDPATTPNLHSIDLDVQYIDAMYLPVAMEVVKPSSPREAGYIGTLNNVPDFQKTLQKIVNGSNLDGYLGGRGWPEIYLAANSNIDPNALIKIPGAYNVFNLSASNSPVAPPGQDFPALTSNQQTGNFVGGPSDAKNYAVSEMTSLFLSWAEFYQQMWTPNSGYDPPGTYLAPTNNLTAILTTGKQQAGVQTFNIANTIEGPADLTRAEDFATTLWYAMWAFSQDPNLNVLPRYITSQGTTTDGSNMLTGLDPNVVSQLQNIMGVVGTDVPIRTQVDDPSPPAPGATSIQMNFTATGNNTGQYQFYYDTLPGNNPAFVPSLQATTQLIQFILGDNVADLANALDSIGTRSSSNSSRRT